LLSAKSAAEPGRWRTARTPYLKEIMDKLSPVAAEQRIVFMKGSQVGGTECGNNWIGYVIHIAPGPMMAVAPTVELAKRHSKQRVDPLLQDVPELRERVAACRIMRHRRSVLKSRNWQLHSMIKAKPSRN
jgi:phage terminase large subunit GpA-like protein